ncbi:MAG: hypothetical protein AB7Q17_18055 [Phycisphaerae bacterium]
MIFGKQAVFIVASAALLTGTAANAQCHDIAPDEERCAGVVLCKCDGLMGSYVCPENEIIDTIRPRGTDGLFELYVVAYTPCYTTRTCEPTFPGGCDPQLNPCKTTGFVTPVGSFFKYGILSLCGIIT